MGIGDIKHFLAFFVVEPDSVNCFSEREHLAQIYMLLVHQPFLDHSILDRLKRLLDFFLQLLGSLDFEFAFKNFAFFFSPEQLEQLLAGRLIPFVNPPADLNLLNGVHIIEAMRFKHFLEY